MQSAKQKAADAAAVAMEYVEILRAKAQEKVEKAAAPTKEGREIAHERRKVEEAEAKMKLHEAKADHAADKLHAAHAHHAPCCGLGGNHNHHHYHGEGCERPMGYAAPPTGAAPPAFPLGGYQPGWTAPK